MEKVPLEKVVDHPLIKKWIQPFYLKGDQCEHFRVDFRKSVPFPHLEFGGFFDESLVEELSMAVADEDWHEKESDLFSFMQTQDLSVSKHPLIDEFCSLIYSKEFISLMMHITDFNLTDKVVDVHGTLYQDTDYLLCHDDELEGRKIAFLLYMADFKKEDGGSLDLFSQVEGKPVDRVASIIPRFNMFTFFEVSGTSYHEVTEVVGDKQRLAIGGWYYAG